jgi:hypothetical protein
MRPNLLRIFLLFGFLLTFPYVARAQETGTGGGQTTSEPAGWENGGYVIHQSVELGYRISDTTGSQAMYNTLVNLQTGPRLLDQTFSMQSTTHEGLLFDNLFVSSFGWGGDPDNALSVRFDKSKWYDFRSSFRRDQTNFDYNLLANPLNPPTSNPSLPVTSSPHIFGTRRRMSDLDLTLLPQSKITFRLGYSRNNMTGPSYSSVHEGTDAWLLQLWNTTLNSYRFGADLKLLPRTVISYDQFLDYYKGDTSWQLNPFAQALLPGTPGTVELGLPIDTGNKSPCAITPPATGLIDSTGTLTNLACNAFFAYNRSDPIRTSTPTERISLHSTYFDWLDLTASYAYSSADMASLLNEFFNGLTQRSRLRQTMVNSPGSAKRVSNVADFKGTVNLPKHFHLVETFRYWAYRIPQGTVSSETDWTVPGSGSCAPPTCSLLTPISATVQSPTVTPNESSFNQNWTTNQLDLVWDPSKHFGGSIGFRYGDQVLNILNFTAGSQERIVVHEYTPVLGLWAKLAKLRVNFNFENTSNSDAIVRIGPRKESRYRLQSTYTPRPWLVIGGSINIWETSNGEALIDFSGHSRNYGFTVSVTPRERFGIDFAYNYNDYQQNTFICFNDSDTSLSVVANAGSCLANGYNDSSNPLLTSGNYTSNTNYGMGSVMFKPIPRLTMHLGYSITSVGGQTPQFNGLQPLGSLQYNYSQPLADIAVDVGHHVTAKAGWNYYQYGEKSFVGPTDPRYFHTNNATLSLLWAF